MRGGLIPLVVLSLLSIGARLQSPPFRDVPATHWAAKAVQDLKDAGILVGYPDQ